LIREGYLTLLEKPEGVVPLGKAKIDWRHTVAWGEGGYYSRIFLNVKGREPQGVIEREKYHQVREELKEKLEALEDEQGKNIGTRVLRPEDVYPVRNGIPPDLIVYFGNLRWRSVGSIGLNTVHTFENDTGPDDANHAENGIFILYDPTDQSTRRSSPVSGLSIYDIAPTVLHRLGVKVPSDMEGKVIH
jgi:predicted AlkP superfamily phosphohydrolase/phosphomutase